MNAKQFILNNWGALSLAPYYVFDYIIEVLYIIDKQGWGMDVSRLKFENGALVSDYNGLALVFGNSEENWCLAEPAKHEGGLPARFDNVLPPGYSKDTPLPQGQLRGKVIISRGTHWRVIWSDDDEGNHCVFIVGQLFNVFIPKT